MFFEDFNIIIVKDQWFFHMRQRHRNVAFFVCHFSTVSAKGIGSKE